MGGGLFDIDIAHWLFELIKTFIAPFWNFLISFFPVGEQDIFTAIDSIGQVGASLTFNVFYLVNFGMVTQCFGVLLLVILITSGVKFLQKAIDLLHKAIETIPFAE